jgi:hypothetical protein
MTVETKRIVFIVHAILQDLIASAMSFHSGDNLFVGVAHKLLCHIRHRLFGPATFLPVRSGGCSLSFAAPTSQNRLENPDRNPLGAMWTKNGIFSSHFGASIRNAIASNSNSCCNPSSLKAMCSWFPVGEHGIDRAENKCREGKLHPDRPFK